ncbi:unnamed protein product [Victoria cruziana]
MADRLPPPVQIIQINHVEEKPENSSPTETEAREMPFDYSQRAQWLRAAALGANDGLVSVASLMLGVSAVSRSAKTTVVSGVAGLIAGAFSMAIGEYVSVYSQVDIELAQMERERRRADIEMSAQKDQEEKLPSPLQAAGASALAFSAGALVPLLAGAFLKQQWTRVGVVSGVSTLALAFFGWVAAKLGGSPVKKSTVRVVVGGWSAMLVTFGVLKLFGLAFKMDISPSG